MAAAASAEEIGADLLPHEQELLADLFAVVAEHSDDAVRPVDLERVGDAFAFSCERHADQRRRSGEEFITHPVGVAKICAGMRLDTETICAGLLHDTVEDTSASLDDVRERFGDDIAQLVDGVTKLTGITFHSRDEQQAENYRKMMVAMATDIRVILIKLADRLHNMRTLEALPKQKQIDKAKETLDIFAPLAHRLGIHSIKWELEDLAFSTLHPRKYSEIKSLVNQQREEREGYVERAGRYLTQELGAVSIEAEVSGRAKHFYSIYSKMTKKGREFNEIYDLTAMRVIVDSVKDCYGAIGIIHSLWKPLPGRFKDYVAMPKFNLYQALHTTVIGPEGRPLEIQIRTRRMHYTAEFGVAAHWIYKDALAASRRAGSLNDEARAVPANGETANGAPESDDEAGVAARPAWLRHLLDWQQDLQDPKEFMETLKIDLFEDEVFVFTPRGRGEVTGRRLDAARLRVRRAHRRGPPLRGREGERQDHAAALPARVGRPRRDPDLQAGAGPLTRLALAGADHPGPEQDPRLVHSREARGRRAPRPRAAPGDAAQAGPAGPEDHGLAAARGRDPRDGLPQGGRLLHRARPGEGVGAGRREQGPAAAEAGRGGGRGAARRGPRPRQGRACPPGGHRLPATGSTSRASTT